MQLNVNFLNIYIPLIRDQIFNSFVTDKTCQAATNFDVQVQNNPYQNYSAGCMSRISVSSNLMKNEYDKIMKIKAISIPILS